MACENPPLLHFVPPHKRVKLADMPQTSPPTAHRTVVAPHHKVIAKPLASTKAESHQQDAAQISQQSVTQHEESRSSAKDINPAGEVVPAIDTKVQQDVQDLQQPETARPTELHCTVTTDGGVFLNGSLSVAPHHIKDAQGVSKTSADGVTIPARVLAPHHTVKENNNAIAKVGSQATLTSSPSAPLANTAAAAVEIGSNQQDAGKAPLQGIEQRTALVNAHSKMVLPARKGNDRWVKDSELRKQEQQRKKDPNPTTEAAWTASWNVNANAFGGVALPKDSGYSLLNYDGTWAPAPENWDSRPAFRDHQSTENIRDWLAGIDFKEVSFPLVLKDPKSSNFYQALLDCDGAMKRYYFVAPDNTQATMGHIIPQDAWWTPDYMEGYPLLQDFWDAFSTMPPSPCDTDDLVSAKPFWETPIAATACFLVPLDQPEHKGVDITDQSKEELRKLECDRGSNHFVNRWMGGWRPHHKEGNGKGRASITPAYTKAPPESENLCVDSTLGENFEDDETIPDLAIQPKVALYLRRAQVSDLAQIADIYNHYVTNTCRVPECTPIQPSRMSDRLRCIKAVSHTFIVACLASGPNLKGIGRGPGKRSPPITDRIIGFAYSDDFNDAAGMYRFLAEIEVFTHPGYTRKGVASCLLDKLVAILDPYWICRGGYEIRDEELGSDASRTVSALWINFPYVPEEEEKVWAGKWLESCGFEQTGDHKKVAFKVGKCANLAVYTRATGCEIDPKQPFVPMADNLF